MPEAYTPLIYPQHAANVSVCSTTSRSPEPTRGSGPSRAAPDNLSGPSFFLARHQQTNPKHSIGWSERGITLVKLRRGTPVVSLSNDEYTPLDTLPTRLSWTLRNSSGVSEGIDKSVVQGGGEFLRIGAGCGQ